MCRVIIVTKNWLICDRCASLFFCTIILSEDPYLKPFISRVFCFDRNRFPSFSRYATLLSVEALFLAALHRAAFTIAVKFEVRRRAIYCVNNTVNSTYLNF